MLSGDYCSILKVLILSADYAKHSRERPNLFGRLVSLTKA